MKFNQWTLGLAAVGLVSLTSAARADEKPSPVVSALASTTISGYVDTSAQWNPGTGEAHLPGYAFGGAGKADGFNLNVVKLSIAKDAEASDAWGAGYKVDLLFGPDANTFGTLSANSAAGGNADFAVKQAYVDLKAPVGNGLEFKMGVWDTIIGYEVFDSVSNPNFTRSYGYTIEPTTHTGIQAIYQVNEMIGLNAAIADTYGPTINGRANPPAAESYKTYMGAVSLTAPKDWGWAAGSTLYACVINGFNAGSPPAGGGFGDQTSFYAGTTINTPLKELKVGAAYDYAGVEKYGTLTAQSGYVNATSLYATYQATEKLSLNARGEYATQTTANAFYGVPSKVLAATLTAQYDLWKNVMTRAEIRWDHQAGSLAPGLPGAAYGGTGATVPSLHNEYELIANVIYKF